MRKDDSTRDGSKNIQAWRLNLVAEYLLREGVTTCLPADWHNYVREYFFELHLNPFQTFKGYLKWLTYIQETSENPPPSYDPLSESAFRDIVTDRRIVQKKSEMCACVQCNELGFNTFIEMVPLFNELIWKIYDCLCDANVLSQDDVNTFNFRKYFLKHIADLKPIESFWKSEG